MSAVSHGGRVGLAAGRPGVAEGGAARADSGAASADAGAAASRVAAPRAPWPLGGGRGRLGCPWRCSGEPVRPAVPSRHCRPRGTPAFCLPGTEYVPAMPPKHYPANDEGNSCASSGPTVCLESRPSEALHRQYSGLSVLHDFTEFPSLPVNGSSMPPQDPPGVPMRSGMGPLPACPSLALFLMLMLVSPQASRANLWLEKAKSCDEAVLACDVPHLLAGCPTSLGLQKRYSFDAFLVLSKESWKDWSCTFWLRVLFWYSQPFLHQLTECLLFPTVSLLAATSIYQCSCAATGCTQHTVFMACNRQLFVAGTHTVFAACKHTVTPTPKHKVL